MAVSRNERLEPLYQKLEQSAANQRRWTQYLWDQQQAQMMDRRSASENYMAEMEQQEAMRKKAWGDDTAKYGAMGASVGGAWGGLIGAIAGTVKGKVEGALQRRKEGTGTWENIGQTFDPTDYGWGGAYSGGKFSHKNMFRDYTPGAFDETLGYGAQGFGAAKTYQARQKARESTALQRKQDVDYRNRYLNMMDRRYGGGSSPDEYTHLPEGYGSQGNHSQGSYFDDTYAEETPGFYMPSRARTR